MDPEKDFDSYMGGIVKMGDYIYGTGFGKRDLRSMNVSKGQQRTFCVSSDI